MTEREKPQKRNPRMFPTRTGLLGWGMWGGKGGALETPEKKIKGKNGKKRKNT